MTEISTLFWDVGGVLLTNGWDRDIRRAAAARFGFDLEEFEPRHEALVSALETGNISFDAYLSHYLHGFF